MLKDIGFETLDEFKKYIAGYLGCELEESIEILLDDYNTMKNFINGIYNDIQYLKSEEVI